MKNEKLMRAMGEIDEDLILEAREERRPRPKWIRWSALAACLALVMLCSPVLISVFGGAHGADPEHEAFSPETDAPATELEVPDKEPEEMTGQNDSANADEIAELQKQLQQQKEALEAAKAAAEAAKAAAGKLEHQAMENANAALLKQIQELLKALETEKANPSSETSDEELSYMIPVKSVVNFILEKKVDAPVSIVVRIQDVGGVSGEWTLSTERGIGDWVILLVDGERVDKLPSEAGSYEVCLDFSALLSSDFFKVNEDFEITSEKQFLIK